MESDFYKNGLAINPVEIEEFSEDQKKAMMLIKKWFHDLSVGGSGKRYFVLSGVAGSGKSSLISKLLDELNLKEHEVLNCAYTGKAALILKRKGLNASTLHSSIYTTTKKLVDNKWVFEFHKVSYLYYKLVVVDEASMIDKDIFNDLMSFGIPVIFIGDHKQLPPVSSKFNLMEESDFRMEKVLRQLEGNPIISLAHKAMLGEKIPFKEFGEGIRKVHFEDLIDEDLAKAGQIIVGTHVKRKLINETLREINHFEGDPKTDEKLIVLSNNSMLNIFNGQIIYLMRDAVPDKSCFKLCYIDELEKIDVVHAFLSEPKEIRATVGLDKDQIFDKKYGAAIGHVDYAYAITCHSSQGSSWEDVMVFDDKFGRWDKDIMNRWLYTAITRAEKTLTIVS